jgi:ubiquinone/menaquinone biosynthesis C-methylase UbiE
MNLKNIVALGLARDVNEFVDMPNGIILNVGAGNKLIANSIPLDWPLWDADKDIIPYEDNSISGVHCYHFLEHVSDPVKVLQEFQRVLCDGGVLNIVVPYYRSQMNYHDLDHKKSFCEETWRVLFSNPYYNKNRIDWKFEIN